MAIRKCVETCKSEWQDRKYKGKRLMNKQRDKGWRCTVCGKEDIGLPSKKNK